VNISIVPVGEVCDVLPELLPYFQVSARWSRGRASADDILRFVLTGQMQLWWVSDERGTHGHFITEVKQYPQCKMLVLQYCAARTGTLDEVQELHTIAEQAARAAGCAGIEFVGRPGWRATARKHGYKTQSVMYQKFFEVPR
jgi:hypothetical protein